MAARHSWYDAKMSDAAAQEDASWFEQEMAAIAAGERKKDLLSQLDGIRAELGRLQSVIGNGQAVVDAINTDLSAMAQDLEQLDERVHMIGDHVVPLLHAIAQKFGVPVPEPVARVVGSPEAEDELYRDALEIVIAAGAASTSFLQRKLGVGYARAARLIDLLEENGVIGAANGARPRKVIPAQ
jgi:DNA segregation ATPase FtsK/SpoIIIE, S-DNA-T family